MAEIPERPKQLGGDYRPHYNKREADTYMDAMVARGVRLEARIRELEQERDRAPELRKPKCPDCNSVGLSHCSDPINCGGVYWPDHMYNQLQAQLAAVTQEKDTLRDALEDFYDTYENGDPCTENGEPDGSSMGNCVSLSYEEEERFLALIPRQRSRPPVLPTTAKLQARNKAMEAALKHCGGYLMTALPVNQPEWLAGIPEIIAEADAALAAHDSEETKP